MARFRLALCSVLLLSACSHFETETATPSQDVSYTKTSFAALPGWPNDKLGEVMPAFAKSCAVITKKDPATNLGVDAKWGTAAAWQAECAAAQSASDPRAFFEQRFTPVFVQAPNSLFTGYYEASLEGSLTQHGPFQTPVYGLPNDFVTADLGAFLPDQKGKTLKGRVQDKKFVPYPDRAGIEAGPLNAPILAWVKDPTALFFMHIQGSGRVKLDDGSTLRLGYAEQNGHAYVPIGRVLKERGELTDVSMGTIRQWLKDHPDQAKELLHQNPSYIFFRKLENDDGPIGAQNVALTPLRSIAVDKSLYAYGLPFYVATENPPLQRLMMAQDTGGAIKGPVRADIFWGYGEQAEAMAGPMQSKGAYWILLPNAVAAALQ